MLFCLLESRWLETMAKVENNKYYLIAIASSGLDVKNARVETGGTVILHIMKIFTVS